MVIVGLIPMGAEFEQYRDSSTVARVPIEAPAAEQKVFRAAVEKNPSTDSCGIFYALLDSQGGICRAQKCLMEDVFFFPEVLIRFNKATRTRRAWEESIREYATCEGKGKGEHPGLCVQGTDFGVLPQSPEEPSLEWNKRERNFEAWREQEERRLEEERQEIARERQSVQAAKQSQEAEWQRIEAAERNQKAVNERQDERELGCERREEETFEGERHLAACIKPLQTLLKKAIAFAKDCLNTLESISKALE